MNVLKDIPLRLVGVNLETTSKTFFMSKHRKAGQNVAGRSNASSTKETGPFCVIDNSVHVSFNVKPGAKLSAITSIDADGVGISIAAPPTDGEANSELIKFLSKELKVRKSDVSLAKGQKSRQKVVSVTGLTIDEVKQRLTSIANQ